LETRPLGEGRGIAKIQTQEGALGEITFGRALEVFARAWLAQAHNALILGTPLGQGQDFIRDKMTGKREANESRTRVAHGRASF